MFVHHNGHEKLKKQVIIVNFKKGIGIEKASNEKSMETRSDQIVWKRIRDGARGSLKSEIKLEDH